MVTPVTWRGAALSVTVPVAVVPPPPAPLKVAVTGPVPGYVPLLVIVTAVTCRRITAVPAAPVPPPPVNDTAGALVKPAPPLVTVTEATPATVARLAVPVAVVPPAGAVPKVTVGAVL